MFYFHNLVIDFQTWNLNNQYLLKREIPFDLTSALLPGDESPVEVLVISPCTGAAVPVLDDPAVPLEEGWSLVVATDPSVCPEESVINSCACKMEFPEPLGEGSTAKRIEAYNSRKP